MTWSEDDRFDLSTLRVGDIVIAQGDDFEAQFNVIRAGQFPGCVLLEGVASEREPEVVQIIGHGHYGSYIVDPSTFILPGVVGGGGSIIFATFSRSGGVELQNRSLTRWKVIRDGQIIYNLGETPDDEKDPDFNPRG